MPNEDNKPVLSGKQVTPLRTTDDYERTNAVYGYNFTELPSLSESKVKEYQDYLGTENIPLDEAALQEAAAQSQGTFGTLTKGLFRALGKAGVEALAIPGYVAAPFTGFDNAWIEATDKLDNTIKEALPVYVSKDIQEGGIADKLGSTAWWATTGADGAGFMLGMLAGNMYAKSLIGLGRLAGNAIGLESKAVSGAEAVSAIEQTIAEGNGLSKNARLFSPMKALEYISPFGKGMAESYATVAINTMSEAGAEANNTYRNVLRDLTSSGMDADKAKELAADAATNVYALNLGVLGLSNSLMEKYVFKGFNTEARPNVELLGNMFSGGEQGVTRSFLNKAFQFGKNAVGGTLSEGFWEEGMQNAIQKVAEKNAKDGDGSFWNTFSNILPKYYKDLTDLEATADSKEMWESVVLGGLLSLPFGAAGTNRAIKDEESFLKGTAEFKPNFIQKNVLRMKERKASPGLIEIMKTNMDLATIKISDVAEMEDGKPKYVNGELQFDPTKVASFAAALQEHIKDKIETDAIKTIFNSMPNTPQVETALKLIQNKQDVQLLGKYAAIKDGDKVFEKHVDYYLDKWKTAQTESGKVFSEKEVAEKRVELLNKVKTMSGIFQQVNDTHDASVRQYKDFPIFTELIRNKKINTALQIDLFSNELRKITSEIDRSESVPLIKDNYYNKLEEDKVKLLKEKQKFYQTQLEEATKEYSKLYTKEGLKEEHDAYTKTEAKFKEPVPVKEEEKSLEEILKDKGLNASKTIHVNSGGYGYYVSPSKEEPGKFFIKTKDKSKDAWVISSDGTTSNKATAVDASVAKSFLDKNKQFIVSDEESAAIKVEKEKLEKERQEREKVETYKKVVTDYLINMQNDYLALQTKIEEMEKKDEDNKKKEELEEKKESLAKTIESISDEIRGMRKFMIGVNFDEQTVSDILQNKETKVNLLKKELSVIKGQLTKISKKIESRKSEIEERQVVLNSLKDKLPKYEYTINVLQSIKADIENKSIKEQEIDYLKGAWRELYEFFKADDIETIERRSFIKMLGDNVETFLSNVQRQKDALDKAITSSQELLDETNENLRFAENNLSAMESKLSEIEEDINFIKELEKQFLESVNDKESKIPVSLRTKETERGIKEYAKTLGEMYARRDDYKNAISTIKQKLREFKETSDKLALNTIKRNVLDNFMTDSFKEKLEELYKTRAIFDKLAKKYTEVASQNLFQAASEHSNEPVYLSTKKTNNPLTTTGSEVATIITDGVIRDKRVDGKLVMNTNPTQVEWSRFTRNLKLKDISKYKIMYFDESMKTKYPELYEQLDNDLRTAGLTARDGIWQVITDGKGEPIKQNGLYLFMGLGLPENLAKRMGETYTAEAGKQYSKMYDDIKNKLSKGELVYSNILGTTKGYANLEYEDGKPVEHKIKEVIPNFNGTVYVGKQTNNPLNIPIGRPYVEDTVFGRTYLLNQRKLNDSEIETVLYLYSMLYGDFNARWEGKQIVPKNPSDISVLQMFINHGSDYKKGEFQNGSRIFVRNGNIEYGIGKDNIGGVVPLIDLVKYFKGEPVNMIPIDGLKEFLSNKIVYWNEKLKNISFPLPKYDKKTNSLVVDKIIQKGDYTKYMVDNVFTLAVNPKHPVVQVNLEYSNPIESEPKIKVEIEEKSEKVSDLNTLIKAMNQSTGLFDKAKINQTPQEKEDEPFVIASDATIDDFNFDEGEMVVPTVDEIKQDKAKKSQSDIEVKKADIERRRQEELNEHKDKDVSKVEEFTFTNEEGNVTYVQVRHYPNGKRMAYQGVEKNKYGNVNDNSPFEISKEQSTENYLKVAYPETSFGKYSKTRERSGEESNLNNYSKKINAKYDAELADLETKSENTPIEKTINDISGKKVKIATHTNGHWYLDFKTNKFKWLEDSDKKTEKRINPKSIIAYFGDIFYDRSFNGDTGLYELNKSDWDKLSKSAQQYMTYMGKELFNYSAYYKKENGKDTGLAITNSGDVGIRRFKEEFTSFDFANLFHFSLFSGLRNGRRLGNEDGIGGVASNLKVNEITYPSKEVLESFQNVFGGDYSYYTAELDIINGKELEFSPSVNPSKAKPEDDNSSYDSDLDDLLSSIGDTPIEDTNIFIDEEKPATGEDIIEPSKIITRDEARDILTTMIDSNTITRECE